MLNHDVLIDAKTMFQGMSKEKRKVNKVLHFHYLICMLLPLLKQINQEQSIELEIEAKIKGSHNGSAFDLLQLMSTLITLLLSARWRSSAYFLRSVTGQKTSEVRIHQAEVGCNKQCCWYVLFC